MSGNKAKLTYTPHTSATREWLLGQVSKSIAKELAQDEDETFLFQLIDRVREEWRDLTGNDEEISW